MQHFAHLLGLSKISYQLNQLPTDSAVCQLFTFPRVLIIPASVPNLFRVFRLAFVVR